MKSTSIRVHEENGIVEFHYPKTLYAVILLVICVILAFQSFFFFTSQEMTGQIINASLIAFQILLAMWFSIFPLLGSYSIKEDTFLLKHGFLFHEPIKLSQVQSVSRYDGPTKYGVHFSKALGAIFLTPSKKGMVQIKLGGQMKTKVGGKHCSSSEIIISLRRPDDLISEIERRLSGGLEHNI